MVDALLEALRVREKNSASMSKEYNSLVYILLLKKKYTCEMKVVQEMKHI